MFNTQQDTSEEQEKEYKTVSLELLKGGKTHIPPEDWLSVLPDGTVFLVRNRQKLQDFVVGLFQKMMSTERTVILRSPSTGPDNIYVIPLQFCNVYSLLEELAVVQNKEETKDEDNDDSDRIQGDGEVSKE